MAAPTDGPVQDQRIVVWQGAAKKVRFVVPDATGVLVGPTGRWWIGPAPVVTAGAAWASVAGAPGAVHRDGLTGIADGVGNTVYAFTIAPADLAGFAPGGRYQHELWVTEPNEAPYPSAIGPLVIQPTVAGAAS